MSGTPTVVANQKIIFHKVLQYQHFHGFFQGIVRDAKDISFFAINVSFSS
ncbi:MAG: hypothetical protein WB341_15325 [Terracidiphilus sp.]